MVSGDWGLIMGDFIQGLSGAVRSILTVPPCLSYLKVLSNGGGGGMTAREQYHRAAHHFKVCEGRSEGARVGV